MKNIALLILLFSMSLSAMGQSDQIINSSVNAHVPPNDTGFLGFIVAPRNSSNDVDVVILAEGAGSFDPVVTVYLDSTSNPPVAGNDDWGHTASDYPSNSATASARSCWASLFSTRLDPLDSLVLLSITAPGGTRSVFARVREYHGDPGKVNLQLLQVDGPLANTCPDF